MVDLFGDKQYRKIMAAIEKKFIIFKNKLQKINEIFARQSPEQSTNLQKETSISNQYQYQYIKLG